MYAAIFLSTSASVSTPSALACIKSRYQGAIRRTTESGMVELLSSWPTRIAGNAGLIGDAAPFVARDSTARRFAACSRRMSYETTRGDYVVSTDKTRLDLNVIHGFLTQSYWCPGVSRDTVQRSIENSL